MIIFINRKGKTFTWDGVHYCNMVIDPLMCCPCGENHGSAPDSECTCVLQWFSDRRKFWDILYQDKNYELPDPIQGPAPKP